MIKWKKRLFTLLGLLLFSVVLAAQVPTGSKVIGTVTDKEGSFLPGVAIEATSPKMVGKATAITDAKGTFRLLALNPGIYRMVFTLQGFKSVVREGVVIGIEQTITLDISMEQGALEEEVTVIGQSPLIDVKSTARGMTLTKDVFQLLPKGRNFDSLVTTVPGVYDDTDLLGGISVDGATGAENMFYVDGTDTTNLYDGSSGQRVSFDFAEEVQFKASGYNAEFGGSVGGVINVITRSGGNEFHGELLGYFSGSGLEGTRRKELSLDFQNDEETATYYTYDQYYGKTDDKRYEGGFSLGGYILKDRLWFYGSFMPVYFKRHRVYDYATVGNPGKTNAYDRTENYWNFAVKLTAQPISNLRVGASFVNNFWKYKGDNPLNIVNSSSTTDYNIYGYSYPGWSASAYADLTLGNNALVSLRGGYFFNDSNKQLSPIPETPYYAFRSEQPWGYVGSTNTMFPEIPASLRHPSSWQMFPRASVQQRNKNIRNRLSFNADFTYYLSLGGEHAWKAGVQFMRRGEDFDDTAAKPIVYLTWNKDFTAYGVNYGRGKYGWYAVRGNKDAGPYGNFYDVKMDSWALYLQDSWTIGRKLTLNLGIRAESEFLPSYTTDPAYAGIDKPVNFPFSKKIAPRLGVVYDVFGDSSLKLYGSFGIYHDVMKLYMGANALGGFKWKSAYYTLDTYDYTTIGVNDNYPGKLLKVLDFRPPVFDSIDKDMKPFTQREISLGAEKMLSENMSVSLRLVNKKVLYAIEDCGVLLPEGEFYYYCNPGGSFINARYKDSIAAGFLLPGTPDMPKAKRDYYGMNIAFDKRLSNNWLAGFSYTLSSLKGNFTGLASGDELGRNNPNGERYFDMWWLSFDKSLKAIDGPLPTDRTHAFKAYGSYVFDFGLTLGAAVNAFSGIPITEEWNVDTPGYYPFNRGNLGRTDFLWFTNVYAEYSLKLGGRYRINFNVNVDNIFNGSTAQWVYRTKYIDNISPGDAALLAKTWEPASNLLLDPRFKYPYNFYDPIAVRLGVRFLF